MREQARELEVLNESLRRSNATLSAQNIELHREVAERGRIEQLLRENRIWGERQAPVRTAAKRHPRATLERALAHAARIDRATKGVGPGAPWDEFVSLGLELLHGVELTRAGPRQAG